MIDPNLINTQYINFFLQFPLPHLTFDSVYRYGTSQTKPKQNKTIYIYNMKLIFISILKALLKINILIHNYSKFDNKLISYLYYIILYYRATP